MSSVPSLPAAMFARIFRKDLRLLWPVAAASAAGQALLASLMYHYEPFLLSDEISAVAAVVTLGLIIAMVLLIVLAVQLDALPGVTQDWLVRPIRRRDLLLAKLLMVAAFIHGPILLVNLLSGLAEGFAFGPLLRAVLLSNFEIAVLFSLPIMAFASLTRTVGEAVLGALAVFFGLLVARLLVLAASYPATHRFDFFDSGQASGVAWVWRSASHLELLVVVVIVLLMQFYRRNTVQSRVLFCSGLLIFMCMGELPERPAFAIQAWLSRAAGVDERVSVGFDAAAQNAPVAGRLLGGAAATKESIANNATNGPVTIYLPLQVTGFGPDRVLHADEVQVRIVGTDARTLYQGSAQEFDLQSTEAALRLPVQIPRAVYQHMAAQEAGAELNLQLTLMNVRSETLLPVASGSEGMTDVGRCASRMSSDGKAVEVACRQAGEQPPCLSVALQPSNGVPGAAEQFECQLNYQPRLFRFATEPIDHFQLRLPTTDSVAAAAVVLRVYEAQAHFSRRVVIPHIQRPPPPA